MSASRKVVVKQPTKPRPRIVNIDSPGFNDVHVKTTTFVGAALPAVVDSPTADSKPKEEKESLLAKAVASMETRLTEEDVTEVSGAGHRCRTQAE